MAYSKIPSVSVVMPTYNNANYINRALDSILNQTFADFEVIVIDNHSTDNTEEIVCKLKDSRVRYFKINNNGVIAKSRNLGIQNARGEWIAFLDSDDWWTDDKLSLCMAHANVNVDVIYHDLKIVPRRPLMVWKNKIKGKQLRKPTPIDLLLLGNVIPNSSVIVRKNIIKKAGLISEDRALVAVEDYSTWLKISAITENFLYIPKPLGYYREHSGGASKRDLSLSDRAAIQPFLHLLNVYQKRYVLANLMYKSVRYSFLSNQKLTSDAKEVLKFGKLILKFKIIIMFIALCCRSLLRNNKI
ncbi:glycosyltransferase [Alphaproteobacteria bacterium]|nr:glycosyltransferase [Alphaproteobacteria bacterium]